MVTVSPLTSSSLDVFVLVQVQMKMIRDCDRFFFSLRLLLLTRISFVEPMIVDLFLYQREKKRTRSHYFSAYYHWTKVKRRDIISRTSFVRIDLRLLSLFTLEKMERPRQNLMTLLFSQRLTKYQQLANSSVSFT